MKIGVLFLLVISVSSCALMQEVEDIRNGKADKDKQAREEAERKKAELEKERLARLWEAAQKACLPNTINLRVGQGQDDIIKLILRPVSVSAAGRETTWHYSLFQFCDPNSQFIPYKVVFNGEKVTSFGVDQNQIERDRAKVIIQKEMTNEEKKE